MDEETFYNAINTLIRQGQVVCRCAFCKSNVTKEVITSLGDRIHCDTCKLYIDTNDEVLYVKVKAN